MKVALLLVAAMLVAGLLVAGCATVYEATARSAGGSKADGVVEMAYWYPSNKRPVVDLEQIQEDASLACRGWGYESARPFGEKMTECARRDPLFEFCSWYRVVVPYQCRD